MSNAPTITGEQQRALAVLADVWALAPDVRLGQLFAHLGWLGEVHLGRVLADIDDDELLGIIERHRDELTVRIAPPPLVGRA